MDIFDTSRDLLNAFVLVYALTAGVLVGLLLVGGLLVATVRGIVHAASNRRDRARLRDTQATESLRPALSH